MTGHKTTVPGVHVFQAIALVALLAAVYVTTPPEVRWRVLAIAAVVGVITSLAARRLYRA